MSIEKWINPYTNRPLKGNNAIVSLRPTTGFDVCAVMFGVRIKTKGCMIKVSCGVCTIDIGANNMWLKGVCNANREEEEYDVKYYIHGLLNGKMHFRCDINLH
jgi:hypothetical protein